MKPTLLLSLILLAVGRMAAQDQSANDLYAAYLRHLSPVERDLLQAIDKIAAERGVPKAEVHRAYRAMFLDGQCMSKGGVGIIRDSVFVVTESDRNEAIAADAKIAGSDFRVPEVFVFARGKFVGRVQVPADDGGDIILALYTPEKVQFYDWRDFNGGHWKRSREDPPNKAAEPTSAAVTTPAGAGDRASGARGSP